MLYNKRNNITYMSVWILYNNICERYNSTFVKCLIFILYIILFLNKKNNIITYVCEKYNSMLIEILYNNLF